MKLLIGFTLVLAIMGGAEAPKPDHVKVLELKVAKQKQENLVLRYQAVQTQVQQMQTEFSNLQKEITDAESAVYTSAHADRKAWTLDAEKEVFTAVAPPAKVVEKK